MFLKLSYKDRCVFVFVSPYQNFTVAVKSVEEQSPQLGPTHTIGRNGTHVAGPYILHSV